MSVTRRQILPDISQIPPHLGPSPPQVLTPRVLTRPAQLTIMADPSTCPPLTRTSVQAAHAIVRPYIHLTPLAHNTTISTLASTPQTTSALATTEWAGQVPARPKIRVLFKCENMQKIGAFKARGAFHALGRCLEVEGEDEVRRRGVVTHSSGISTLISYTPPSSTLY